MDLIAKRRAHREKNVALLALSGFAPQPWLPLREHKAELRPTEEIVRRMMAVGALCAWLEDRPAASRDDDTLRAHVARNGLAADLTPFEREALGASLEEGPDQASARRDEVRAHVDALWALAWVLGHEPAPAYDGRAIGDEVRDSVLGFAQRGLDASVEGVLSRVTLRGTADVVVVEDLFFCAHNAARLAAFGAPSARPGFDPDRGGPAIEARRHALTWVLSPGVAWEDTDLGS